MTEPEKPTEPTKDPINAWDHILGDLDADDARIAIASDNVTFFFAGGLVETFTALGRHGSAADILYHMYNGLSEHSQPQKRIIVSIAENLAVQALSVGDHESAAMGFLAANQAGSDRLAPLALYSAAQMVQQNKLSGFANTLFAARSTNDEEVVSRSARVGLFALPLLATTDPETATDLIDQIDESKIFTRNSPERGYLEAANLWLAGDKTTPCPILPETSVVVFHPSHSQAHRLLSAIVLLQPPAP